MTASEKLELLDKERAIRERLFGSEPLTFQERQLLGEQLVDMTKQRLDAEPPAPGERPLPAEIAKLAPAAAAEKAKAIRERPEYWRPDSFDKDGNTVLTKQAHTALVQEHNDLIRRASDES